MPGQSVEEIQKRIKDLEDSLSSLESIDNQHTLNSLMAWITGVPANIAQPVADAVFNSPLGERVPGLKQSYELINKIIEIKTNDNSGKELPDKLIDLSEITNILEGDEDDSKLISLTKAVRLVQQGDKEGALKELASNFVPDPVKDGWNIAEGIETAQKNQKEVSDQWSTVKSQIQNQREDLKNKIQEENNKLYHLSGGKLGALNSGPKSPNVFTRIKELLAEIDMKIQRLQTNLQV